MFLLVHDPVASDPGEQSLTVTLRSLVPPDFGMAVCYVALFSNASLKNYLLLICSAEKVRVIRTEMTTFKIFTFGARNWNSLQCFSVKGHIINIFSFAGHMVTVVTSHLFSFSIKATRDNM